jgi:hypothetical protein
VNTDTSTVLLATAYLLLLQLAADYLTDLIADAFCDHSYCASLLLDWVGAAR